MIPFRISNVCSFDNSSTIILENLLLKAGSVIKLVDSCDVVAPINFIEPLARAGFNIWAIFAYESLLEDVNRWISSRNSIALFFLLEK